MATEHNFHLGTKTEHAQGDLIDTTHQESASAVAGGDVFGRKTGDAADSAQWKAQEGKEQAGNIFQKTGGAIKNAVDETVHEVQSKLGKGDDPAKVPLED